MNRILLTFAALCVTATAWAHGTGSTATVSAPTPAAAPAVSAVTPGLPTLAPAASEAPSLAAELPTSRREARAQAKRSLKDLIKNYRAESKALRRNKGHLVSAAAGAAAAKPIKDPRSNLRFRLILGLIGIAAAIIFYAVGEPVAGTIFLIPGLFLFGWWLFDYI